ncbi:MAG: ATPase [Candidatus Tectomicrobia bacterium]|nr:ATPase [Candidatus Tectomicrobia bacterium]
MKEQSKNPVFQGSSRDRLIREWVHDPYKSKSKLPEPTVCPECGAVFHKGRWQWADKPAHAHEERCPACLRVHDKYPAGFLTLEGQFLQEHREEILNLARNKEAQARAEHPLQRIMKIEEQEDRILVTTTDTHLARGIGEALHHAYQGELDFHYSEEGSILRVSWRR